MHGHIDSHQVHWYAWGNISAFIAGALTLHNQALAFLPVKPCLAAGLCVSYLHFSLCLCQILLCFIGTAIMKYSIAKAVWCKGCNLRMIIENTRKKDNKWFTSLYSHYNTLYNTFYTTTCIFIHLWKS